MRARGRVLGVGPLLMVLGCATPPASRPSEAPLPAAVDAWAVPQLPAAPPISREEYQGRRAALTAGMADGLLVILGSEEPEADYLPFAQRAHFRYLTGLSEPGAALLIEKQGGEVSERLFVLPRDPAREVWEGIRLGADGATARTGIHASPVRALAPALDSVAARAPRLYTLSEIPEPGGLLQRLSAEQQLVRRLAERYPRLEVVPFEDPLLRLRATKSVAELDRIRRAVYITTLAHRAAMRTAEPGMNEFELQALVEYTFRRNGAERPAFASIVGSGPNSTTLHYRSADRFFTGDETVVLDIGASYQGYAADVTRTLPVSGRFSPDQRAIYEIVLAAQKAAEEMVRPGATWGQLSRAAEEVLAAGLARLGLIDAPDATYQCGPRGEAACAQLRLFYMHGLGHGIGLDVHDPDISTYGPFRHGSVFTIEPGIYVRADVLEHLADTPANRAMASRLRSAVQRYRNTGVRIEDDYILGASGAERISSGAPREIAEIEALMALPDASAGERRGEVVEWYRSTSPR